MHTLPTHRYTHTIQKRICYGKHVYNVSLTIKKRRLYSSSLRLHCNIFPFVLCLCSLYILHWSWIRVYSHWVAWEVKPEIFWAHWRPLHRNKKKSDPGTYVENLPSIITVKPRCTWYMSAWWGERRPGKVTTSRKVLHAAVDSGDHKFIEISWLLQPLLLVFLSDFSLYFLMVWIFSESLRGKEEGFG